MTIRFDDGTGLIFRGNVPFIAEYCELKEDNTSTITFDIYTRTETSFEIIEFAEDEEREPIDYSAEVLSYVESMLVIYEKVKIEISNQSNNTNWVYGQYANEIEAEINALDAPELSLPEKVTIGILPTEIKLLISYSGQYFAGRGDLEDIEAKEKEIDMIFEEILGN